MVEIDFLAANHVCIVGLCGQNWNRTQGYSFSLRSLKAYVLNVVKYLTTVDHATTVHGRGLPWAQGTGRHAGPWALAVHSSQFIDWSTVNQSGRLSNCQDGCQTNSRRYDDLLSTDRVDVSNTYRVIVLVWLGAVRSAIHSVSWASC